MMNLALNISLTDEQYNDLMTKTHEKLYLSHEFVNELSKVILTQTGDYLKNHPDEIKKALGISVPHWERNAVQNENKRLMTDVIKKAAEDYSTEISDNVEIALKNVLQQTDLTSIIQTVLSNAILKGMSSGLNDYLMHQSDAFSGLANEVETLKSRLNNI